MKELEATVEPEAQNGHSDTAELESRVQELTLAHKNKDQVIIIFTCILDIFTALKSARQGAPVLPLL